MQLIIPVRELAIFILSQMARYCMDEALSVHIHPCEMGIVLLSLSVEFFTAVKNTWLLEVMLVRSEDA